jgi:hypothetical protein
MSDITETATREVRDEWRKIIRNDPGWPKRDTARLSRISDTARAAECL